MPRVERAVLAALRESENGRVRVEALDRTPGVVKYFGYGVEAVDVVSAMQARGVVDFDPQTGIVRLNGH